MAYGGAAGLRAMAGEAGRRQAARTAGFVHGENRHCAAAAAPCSNKARLYSGIYRSAAAAAAYMLNSLEIEGRPGDTRVVVAMSGGVDSSVTAALLKAEGYDVVGVTLQLYDHGAVTHRKGACCAGQDIHDARAVADRIGIPHYVLDYESRFKTAVIDRFAESYVSGETPVPCVDCNTSIKFRDLLDTARELGAKVLATGHYVASRALPGGGRALYRAKEEERDQSYFLFGTTHAQLELLRFPLGDKTKAETRELARHFGLAVADKHDSQDICFVPSGRYTDVIERLKPGAAEAGDIVDLEGKVLGRHDGIIHFTIGQRRGLKIAAGAPLYVLALDAAAQRVVVGPREALTMRRIQLRDVNWIGEGVLDRALNGERINMFVKVRSTRSPQPAFLSSTPTGYEVELVEGEDGVSPGQACVFYDSAHGQARVLGGGFIRAAAAAAKAA
jgi:tRNA-specific 2-thiouridylase